MVFVTKEEACRRSKEFKNSPEREEYLKWMTDPDSISDKSGTELFSEAVPTGIPQKKTKVSL